MSCAALSSGYEPSALVTAFHSIPHVDIDLNPSPDDFQLSLEYFEVSWPGVVGREKWIANAVVTSLKEGVYL